MENEGCAPLPSQGGLVPRFAPHARGGRAVSCGPARPPLLISPPVHAAHEAVVIVLGPALELGHIIPKRKGGSNDPSNLRTLCRAHHEDKGGVRRAYKGASAREP